MYYHLSISVWEEAMNTLIPFKKPKTGLHVVSRAC